VTPGEFRSPEQVAALDPSGLSTHLGNQGIQPIHRPTEDQKRSPNLMASQPNHSVVIAPNMKPHPEAKALLEFVGAIWRLGSRAAECAYASLDLRAPSLCCLPARPASIPAILARRDLETAAEAMSKPRLSEAEAVQQFVLYILRGVEESWPQIAEQLREGFTEDAPRLDDQSTSFEFCLAVIASQIQALPNLLSADQAQRIRSQIVRCLSTEALGSYPSEAIDEYQAAWDQCLQSAEPPFYGVASVLYDKLGCSANVRIGSARFKSPLMLMALADNVVYFGGPCWKTITSTYEIIA
jgi:hypothetical protein